MKEVSLTDGSIMQVDDEDYEYARQQTWSKSTLGYAVYRVGELTFRFHAEVLCEVPFVDAVCDHIDGNKLNNQKANLRWVTRQQNAQNRGKNKNNTTGFKGVTLRGDTGKYQASLRLPIGLRSFGCYDTAEEAAKAYDKAALQFHGKFAKLNFSNHSTVQLTETAQASATL